MTEAPRKRNPESGFALLFIYAMAAIIAIMLYREIPRVAFEAQRDKEQLLIDRGEQYSRAVNLYVRKFNKFPADFDALKNTQNLRFLRHKYLDPMTGKDDWRIIHVGPGGVFTDSLVYGKKKDDKQQAEQQNFITELQQTGGNQIDPNQNVNVGTRQRQSDQPGAPGDPANPGQPPQFDANGQPVQPQGNQPGVPGQFQPGAGAFAPGAPIPGAAPIPGGPSIPGGQPLGPQQPYQPQNGPGPPTAAGNLINQILTTPRPGGLNGIGGVQQGAVDPNASAAGTNSSATTSTGTSIASLGNMPAPPTGQTIGGGIAGVASKLEEDGIKIYRDEKSYHKWEFVYDITKDPARGGGTIPSAAPPPGTPIGGTAPGSSTTAPATPTSTSPTPAPVTPAPVTPPVTPQ